MKEGRNRLRKGMTDEEREKQTKGGMDRKRDTGMRDGGTKG